MIIVIVIGVYMDDVSGLKRYVTNGYYQYYIPSHHLANKAGLVYEHMMVAEDMLGRELREGEVVHHEDRNRKNNSYDNLMVFKTNADHVAYHMGRDIELDGDVYVAINKYVYDRKKYKKDNNNNKYAMNECPVCGELKYATSEMCLSCRQKEQAKNIPPKEDLHNLLKDHSILSIGRIYNVSDNAVRKWCKKYGLPFNRKDIDKFKEEEFGIIKIVKEKQEPTKPKPVVMLDKLTMNLLNTFNSAGQAGIYLGDRGYRTHISSVCKGNRKTAYGYKWMWLEDYLDSKK